MKDRLDALFAFLDTGIWGIAERDLPRPKAVALRAVKVLVLAFRGFQRHQCSMKASALTFYSLLSVVPIAAVFFGIAKGFGFDRKLQAQLLSKFPGQTDVLMKVFEFSNALLQKTKGGIVAGIGVVLLFWSVIKVLGHIEEAFNDIWQVEHGRGFGRKLSDYLSFTLVCPVIFVFSSSLTVTLSGQVKSVAAAVSAWGVPAAPLLALLQILPLLLIWVLFAFVYVFMPNTEVRLRSGILAAMTAGSVYQVTQVVYIAFQVGVARANAIYGSFAALPLFLAWMQISWLIVLLGCEISFAVQNLDRRRVPESAEEAGIGQTRMLSLLIARMVVRSFSEGKKAPTPLAIADALGIPAPLARRILSDLSAAGLFSAVQAQQGEESAYQPARDIHDIRVKTVLDALERCGPAVPLPPTVDLRTVSETLEAFGQAIQNSPANRLLMDL